MRSQVIVFLLATSTLGCATRRSVRALSAAHDATSARVASLQEASQRRTDGLERERIEPLESRAAATEDRLSAHDAALGGLDGRVTGLERRLAGFSETLVHVRPSRLRVAYANQAGHHARVTLTHRGSEDGTPCVITVATRRIARPPDAPLPAATPPRAVTTTAELELGGIGAVREIVVACGSEVVASARPTTALLDILVEYEEAACESP